LNTNYSQHPSDEPLQSNAHRVLVMKEGWKVELSYKFNYIQLIFPVKMVNRKVWVFERAKKGE